MGGHDIDTGEENDEWGAAENLGKEDAEVADNRLKNQRK